MKCTRNLRININIVSAVNKPVTRDLLTVSVHVCKSKFVLISSLAGKSVRIRRSSRANIVVKPPFTIKYPLEVTITKLSYGIEGSVKI